MVKTLFFLSFPPLILMASEPSALLQKNCLECHAKQKIPSEFIYRRYLITYSSQEKIQSKLFSYLQAPKKENSIMPKQFFLKFPMKNTLDLNESVLEQSIEAYLDYFDVKRQLVLEEGFTK